MREITIENKKVTELGLALSLPFMIVFLFEIFNNWISFYQFEVNFYKQNLLIFDFKILNSLIIIVIPILILLIGIVIHELIHGICMLIFVKKNNTVRFGFNTKYLMPFANCLEPIYPTQMIIVALSPFVILGFLPAIYGFYFKNLFWLITGFSMTLGAVGDFIYVYLIVSNIKNKRGKILDHKTKVGFYIIEN